MLESRAIKNLFKNLIRNFLLFTISVGFLILFRRIFMFTLLMKKVLTIFRTTTILCFTVSDKNRLGYGADCINLN